MQTKNCIARIYLLTNNAGQDVFLFGYTIAWPCKVMQASMPKKILVAVDGSEPSLKAAAYAAKLANLNGSEIVALHVILIPHYASQKTVESLRKELYSKSDEIMQQAKKASSNIKPETKVIETDRSVVEAIVEFALKSNIDLIVLGTRGSAGIPKLMLGSVAAGVVNSAHCPVLAVR